MVVLAWYCFIFAPRKAWLLARNQIVGTALPGSEDLPPAEDGLFVNADAGKVIASEWADLEAFNVSA